MYQDDRGMLFTFDDARGNHGWHNQTIQSDANSFSGNYLQLYKDGVVLKADGSDWADDGYHSNTGQATGIRLRPSTIRTESTLPRLWTSRTSPI